MIAGFHIIFGAYGFWLPNDPRGSWSVFVGSWDLYRFGPATKTTETQSVAHRPHDVTRRLTAKRALLRPAVQFSGIQARAVARGIGEYVQRAKLAVWACAVLPDHVHLVVSVPHIPVDRFVQQLKGAATRQLIAEDVHPFRAAQSTNEGPPLPCFSRGHWKVALHAERIPTAVRYVEQNPEKEGKPRQRWSFVVPYVY